MDQDAGFGELEDDDGRRRESFTIAIRWIAHDMGIELDQSPTPLSERRGQDQDDEDQDQDPDEDDEDGGQE